MEACSGAFLLIRREALEAVGGWDERYWFYAEDLDLCLRVTQAGWRVRYVGTASAVHVKGSSSNLRRSPSDLTDEQRATRRRVREAIIDSHERFYREHLEAGTARPLRPLVEPHVPAGPGPDRPTRVGRLASRRRRLTRPSRYWKSWPWNLDHEAMVRYMFSAEPSSGLMRRQSGWAAVTFGSSVSRYMIPQMEGCFS